MFRSPSRKRRFGFTLVEVLVTTVVIGVLAAVVLPALARQTSAADPARVSSDLANIKMGIEVFSQNLRPDFPGDLEDLVNAVSSGGDLAIDGQPYANFANWKGPYVAQTLEATETTVTGSTPWRAGGAGFFENQLKICDLAANAGCESTTGSQFVAVQINGLTATEQDDINTMLDGVGEANSSTSGMFRVSGTDAFYYTIPYTP